MKRAILAVAHRILVAAYYMLRDRVPYREPGAPPVDEQRKARLLSRMLKGIENLGYGSPVGHLIGFCEVGEKDVAAGDVALQVFQGVGTV